VDLKSDLSSDHRIHVEFAHFSNLEFFKLFEKYAVRHADSVGMNEQELVMLLDLWEGEQDVRRNLLISL
jgi:ADP-dependent phosphofructokinase/glucokinase